MAGLSYRLVLGVACLLSGCMGVKPAPPQSSEAAAELKDEEFLKREFSFDDPAGMQAQLSAFNRIEIRETLSNTARGAHVSIVDETGNRYMGTFLRKGPHGVELMNSVSREVVSGPNGQQYCKTSHVPFQTIPTEVMTHFNVMSQPPADFPASDDEINRHDLGIAELIFRSGLRQRWGHAPTRESLAQ